MRRKRLTQTGFTLVELLIVITIIAILGAMLSFINPMKQISRGYDSVRKKDLNTIKIVFEDYYSDHLCYPPAGILDVCGGDQLLPYMDKIPCDPQTKLPYLYAPEANDCSAYRLLTTLGDKTDPYIEQVGCSSVTGCGVGGADYNYGISSGVPVAGGGPTPPPNYYACSFDGICTFYADPALHGCPLPYYTQPDCNNQCGNPANRCTLP